MSNRQRKIDTIFLLIGLFLGFTSMATALEEIVVDSFEEVGKWEIEKPFPGVDFVISEEKSKVGASSGKLSWSEGESGAIRNITLKIKDGKEIPGNPNTIGFWIYGGGTGNFFRFYFIDKKGQQFETSKYIDWKSWNFFEMELSGYSWDWGPPKKIEYPLSFSHLTVEIKNRRKATLYLDGLSGRRVPEEKTVSFYEKPSTPSIFSSISVEKFWFPFVLKGLGNGDIEKDKKILDDFRRSEVFNYSQIIPFVSPAGAWPLSPERRREMYEVIPPDCEIDQTDQGQAEIFFGKEPSSPDSYFRKLCRLFVAEKIYFLLGSTFNLPPNRELDSVLNRYVAELGRVSQEEAPDYFLGFRIAEFDGCHKFFRDDTTGQGREKRANATIKDIKEHIKVKMRYCDGKRSAMTSQSYSGFNPGYGYESGFGVISPSLFQGWTSTQFQIANVRGAAKSFGQTWGTEPTTCTNARFDEWGRNVPDAWEIYPRAGLLSSYPWYNIPPCEIYKAFILGYYSGSRLFTISAAAAVMESGSLTAEPFCGKPTKDFLDYTREHPRIGKEYIPTAIIRSHLDNMYLRGPSKNSRENYNEKMMGHCVDDADRDWIFLNIWFPYFSTSENLDYCGRYWTGTPFGPIDILYDRVPDLSSLLSNYEKVILLGYQDITADMYKALSDFVKKGGILFVEAPHILSLNSSLQKELFGCEISDAIVPVLGKISFINSSPLDYPKGETYDAKTCSFKQRPEVKGEIYKITLNDGEVIAQDKWENPVLVGKRYGKGYTLLCANYLFKLRDYGLLAGKTGALNPMFLPTFDDFTYTILEKIATYQSSTDIAILPGDTCRDTNIEYILREDRKKGELQLFLMNHGPFSWEGTISLDKERFGLEKIKVSEAVAGGYEEVALERLRTGKDVFIKVRLEQNGERDAQFTLFKIEKER